jgi:hypothetical protein
LARVAIRLLQHRTLFGDVRVNGEDLDAEVLRELAPTENYQAAGTTFVDWRLVRGTFAEGMRFYLGLPGGLARAIFMMFFVSEVHPFVDGQGEEGATTHPPCACDHSD